MQTHTTIKTRPSTLLRVVSVAAASLLATTFAARSAHADEVSPTGKGITGGALLGAEVVTMVESFAGVRKGWAYGVGAIVGAAGGGVGGYFVEQGSSDGRAPVYMLAGGLALVIPAVVLTLNATRYQSDEGAVEETTVTTGPAAEPGTPPPPAGAPVAAPPPATTPAPTTTPPPSGGGALLHMDVDPTKKSSLGMGVPVPTVKQMWTTAEQKQYGLAQGTELRLPVLRVTF